MESPYASDWIKDMVEEELKLYGIDKPVFYSKMNDEALFFPSRKQLREILQQIEADIKDKS